MQHLTPSIDAGRRGLLQLEERPPQRRDIRMVKQGGELQLAVLAGGSTHAVRPVCPVFCPARRPGRVGLFRVPLGRVPFLRPLRGRFSHAFVRGLRG